ncbi:hypothetical protein AAVH_19909 [Aphelenchoides avenae]|nr:hypothetical protein AAVH_19909 [Aphelenchus avenae]
MLVAALIVAKVLRLLLWATTAEAASQCYSTGKNPATTLKCNTTCYVAVYDAEEDHLYRGCGTLEHDPEKATVGMLHVYFCNEDLCNAGNTFGKATSNLTESELIDAVENITSTIAAIENATEVGTTMTSTAEASTSWPITETSGATTVVASSGATTTTGPHDSQDEGSTTTSTAGTTVPATHTETSTQAGSTLAETTTAWPGFTTTHGQDAVIVGASAELTPATTEHSTTAQDESATTIMPTTRSSSLDSSSTLADLTTIIGVTEPSSTTTPGPTTLHGSTLPGAELTSTTTTPDGTTTKPKASIRTSRDNETARDATVMNENNTSNAGTSAQPVAEPTTAKQGATPDEWTAANASSSTEAAAIGGNASSAEPQSENSTMTKWAPTNASDTNTNGSMAGKDMHTLAASSIVAPASVNAAGVSTPERQLSDSDDSVTLGNGASAVGKIGMLVNFALLAVFLR